MRFFRSNVDITSAPDLPEFNKRVLTGAVDSRVDVGALAANGTDLKDEFGNGVPDLAKQRVMVLVKATGEALSVQASRVDLATRYDLSQRDLSLLDPWVPLPIPISFMVRKRAILANFGAVRIIISRCECIVVMSGRVDEKFIFGEEADINDPLTNKLKQAATQDTPDKSTTVPGTADRRSYSPVENSLPFELRVLDTALEEACRLLGIEVIGVVTSGKDRIESLALEKTSYRGSGILEELKAIRSNMGALRSRVQMLKKELEDVMNDDQDMLDMLLQRRYVLSNNDLPLHAQQASMQPPHALHTMHSGSYVGTMVPSAAAVLGMVRGAAQPPGGGGYGHSSPNNNRFAGQGAGGEVVHASVVAEEGDGGEAGVDDSQGDGQKSGVHAGTAAAAVGQQEGPEQVGGSGVLPQGDSGEVAADSAAQAADVGAAAATAAATAAASNPPPPNASSPASPLTHPQDSLPAPLPPHLTRTPWSGTAQDRAGLIASFGSVISSATPQPSPPHSTFTSTANLRHPSPAPGPAVAAPPSAPTLRTPPSPGVTGTRNIPLLPHAQTDPAPPTNTAELQQNSIDTTLKSASLPHADDQTLVKAVSAPESNPLALSGSSALEPDRVKIGDRNRLLSKMGQYHGWEGKKRNKTQGGAAPGAHPSPGRMQAKGASQELHHDDTVRLSIDLKGPRRRWRGSGTNKGAKGGGGGPAAAAGGLLRRGRARRVSGTGGGTAGRPGGGAPSTPSSQRSAAGGSDSGTAAPNTPSSVHTMRSFTSNAEAVNLEHVKQEDPWEDEARAKYLYPHLDRRQPYEVLEAYTLQLDYYLAQLDDLSADIEEFWVDTQQELGRKRNSLFALQILVNTVTMGFSFVSMVGAIFGMNLRSGVEDAEGWFNWVTILSCGLATGGTVALMMGLHLQGMLSLKKGPEPI